MGGCPSGRGSAAARLGQYRLTESKVPKAHIEQAKCSGRGCSFLTNTACGARSPGC